MEHELFKEAIQNYDLLQLENWIRRCRSEFKKENYFNNNSNKTEEDYKEAVLIFVEDWKEHYENNEDFYDSEIYKKAILACGLKKYDFVFKSKNKTRILNDDVFYNKLLNHYDQDDNLLMYNFFETRLNSIFEYYVFFDTELLLLNRNDYRKIICEWIEYKFNNYSFVIEVNEESILSSDIDELIELLDDAKVKVNFKKHCHKLKKMALLRELYTFDITKQSYYDYKNMDIVKDFDKKLILNIGLSLSLDIDSYEKLLNIHGFSIENSKDLRDLLMKQMILNGLGKEYIDIVLEDKNIKDIKKRSGLFDKRDNCYNIYYYYNENVSAKKEISSKMKIQYIKACKEMVRIITNFIKNLDRKEKYYQDIIIKKQEFVNDAPDKLFQFNIQEDILIKKISKTESNIESLKSKFNQDWLCKEKLGTLSSCESKLLTNHREQSLKLKEDLKTLKLQNQKNKTKNNNLDSKLDYETKMIEEYENKIFELKYEGCRYETSSPKPKKYFIFQYSKINSENNSLEEDSDKPCDTFSATLDELESLKNKLESFLNSKEATL